MSEGDNRYLNLLNLSGTDDVILKISELSSDLSDEDHRIRSSIFDLHAALHLELRRIFYHIFRPLVFLDDEDGDQREAALEKFDKRIGKLGHLEIFRVLEPILLFWPLDFDAFIELDRTRNQIAHGAPIDHVSYKNRNPFTNADCFAQMYFDVWAAQQAVAKFFDTAIEEPRERLRRYQKKFGFGH
jgi:hypothetical protein